MKMSILPPNNCHWSSQISLTRRRVTLAVPTCISWAMDSLSDRMSPRFLVPNTFRRVVAASSLKIKSWNIFHNNKAQFSPGWPAVVVHVGHGADRILKIFLSTFHPNLDRGRGGREGRSGTSERWRPSGDDRYFPRNLISNTKNWNKNCSWVTGRWQLGDRDN